MGRNRLPVQLSLDQARRPIGRGGWRPGAGRPGGRTTASHAPRVAFTRHHPIHVTLRFVSAAGALRRAAIARIVRDAIARGGHRPDFRVLHFNLLRNHLHALVEADDPAALARGMQGLNVRLARRINTHLARRGALLAERYHDRPLRTPREVRAVLRYILLNARHHAAEHGRRIAASWLDPFSSALWFDGWLHPIRTSAPWLHHLLHVPRPTAAPRSWLARTGWRLAGGAIPIDDIPGHDASARAR